MQKLQTFGRTVIKSLTSPQYYRDLLRAKFGFALKYFLFAHLIFALIIAVFASLAIFALNPKAIADRWVNDIPSDLIVYIQNGKLSINKPLPYEIPLPTTLTHGMPATIDGSLPIRNLVVFDSDKNVQNPTQFSRYQTLALVTEDLVYTRSNDSSNGVKVTPFGGGDHAKSMTFSTAQLKQLETQFFQHPLIQSHAYVLLFVLFVLLIVGPILTLWHFITALVYSIVIFVIARLGKDMWFRHRKYSYMQVVHVSLITLVPVLFLRLVTLRAGLPGFGGGIFFLMYAVLTCVALWGAGKETAVSKTVVRRTVSRAAAKPVAKATAKRARR